MDLEITLSRSIPVSSALIPGLSSEETRLLAELQEQARLVAPQFSQEFLQEAQLFLADTGSQRQRQLLQEWFMGFFVPSNAVDSGLHQAKAHLQPAKVITGLDVILHYASIVIRHSNQPAQASQAFYKALILRIISQLPEVQEIQHHLYEMMLLD